LDIAGPEVISVDREWSGDVALPTTEGGQARQGCQRMLSLSPISKSAAEKSRLRRLEFLKLAPAALIGAFAIPRVQRAALPFASDLTGRALGGPHRYGAFDAFDLPSQTSDLTCEYSTGEVRG